MRSWISLVFLSLVITAAADEESRPLMRDFIGINGHTVQFKPELYRPVAGKVRDYHPLDWDIGKDTSVTPDYPWAVNRVNWETVYRPWVEVGYEIDACLMIQAIPPDAWKDLERDGRRIGKAFASFFGPSGERKLVTSVEVGNEPGKYPDARYREVFESMATGIRAGDPKVKIVTCATVAGESHDYAKSLETVKGLEKLYDVINLHTYAQIENWPTWRRSFPEDPSIEYLKEIEKVIAWKNQHAAGKEIWITEFGWDSTTKPNKKEGTFKDWVGNTDEEQAVYLVRSLLVFAGIDVARAYIYFFNDSDEPALHASSGLTRNFEKKPSYFAIQWLQDRLGDYRFVEAIARAPGEPWQFRFEHGNDSKNQVLAIWEPVKVGEGKAPKISLPAAFKSGRAERLTTAEGKTDTVLITDGALQLGARGYPVLVWSQK